MDKVIIDKIDVSGCEHYRAEIETKMPYGKYEILKDKCHYSGIEIIQNCKGNKGCIYKQLQRLKEENEQLNKMTGIFSARLCEKYRTTLQEIREIADIIYNTNCNYVAEFHKIITKINEVIGAKE